MDHPQSRTLDARLLPSAHYIPGAVVYLSASLPSDDLLAFDLGPSTSLDAFPVPALDRHCLAISTAGEYPVECQLGGEFHRGHIVSGGAGSLSFIPAGLPSQWRVCTGTACNTNLFLAPSLLSRVTLEVFGTDPARLSPRPVLLFEDRLLYETGLAIACMCRGQRPLERIWLDSLTQALAVHLLVNYMSVPGRVLPVRGRLSAPVLKQVLDCIEAQLAGDLRLSRLASLASLSPYHFARLFQQAMGQPLHRYVLDRRLQRGCRLLLDTDLSLAQIASDTGFSDESHFLRRFKFAYGITPSALRKDRKILR